MSKRNHKLVFLFLSAVCLFASACGNSSGNGNTGGGNPVLALSESTLTFAGVQGSSADPAPASVNVTNSGTGALNFTASTDSPWLAVTPGNGLAPQSLQISATIGSLTPATYTGHVTVTATGAQGSPAMVAVTFTVGSQIASTTPFWQQWGSNPAAHRHGPGSRPIFQQQTRRRHLRSVRRSGEGREHAAYLAKQS